jgi:tRNA(fMet)-specific endonuclease VapC
LSQTNIDYLLDTSVLIEILDQNAAMQPHLATANDLYISAVALGELFYGAQNSTNPAKGTAEVDALSQTMGLLIVDGITARAYGAIKRELRIKGQMIPDNDIWIAAIARQYALTLATRDAHFNRVAGLQIETW